MASLKNTVKRRLTHHPLLYEWVRRAWRASPFFGSGGASAYWDQLVGSIEDGAHQGWLDSPFVEDEYIRPQVSGDRSVYYLEYFFDQYFPERTANRGLSLGCGGGNLERGLVGMNAAQTIDAHDASPASIELARQLAQEDGIAGRIRYHQSDINTLDLEPNTYDWVICKMSLHHFEALEHVYQQVRRTLSPNGLFMFNEFVGPTRHQWTDLQLDLMNQMLDALPASLRREVPLRRLTRPTIREMIAIDPSESVRSAEIMPLLKDDFEVLEYKPYGGTLLQVFLQQVLHLLDLKNPEHEALIRGWFDFETTHIAAGTIPSDFAFVVARPL